MQLDNEPTPKIGTVNTQTKSGKSENDTTTPKERDAETGNEPLTGSEYHTSWNDFNVTSVAEVAIERAISWTSTTTTELESFVGSSVVPATKVWDFLGMTQRPSVEHMSTSPLLQYSVSIRDEGFVLHGPGNWLKGGKPTEEYTDSGLRHVRAFLEGEIYDPDTGCHHLAHAVWNFNAAQTLNLQDHPPIDPDFDQTAFLQEYTSPEEVPGVTRAFTKEELQQLKEGQLVRSDYFYTSGVVVEVDSSGRSERLVIRVRQSNGSTIWWKEEDRVWLV